MKALWKDQILAESADTILVENNHYFPPESLNKQFFTKSDTTSTCPWKGTANYYSILVAGEQNVDAAWYYPRPLAAAAEIKDHVAFWRGVEVRE